jgi:lysozyme
MKTGCYVVLSGLSAILIVGTMPPQFNQPWNDQSRAILIDPYEGNRIDWSLLGEDPRVVAIIHRATSGLKKDAKYSSRRTVAKANGYMWGSYHLGLPGDPIKQADFYLHTVEPSEGEVIALDIESLDPTRSITLPDAVKFLGRVHERIGRYPLVYANHEVTKAIAYQYADSTLFGATGLWYARFRKTIPDFPNGTWSTYTIWQFSSELNCRADAAALCLYRVPGTDFDMDVDVFNGSIDELRARWPNVMNAAR